VTALLEERIAADRNSRVRFLGLAELDITIASSRTALSKVMKRQDFLIPCIDKAVAKQLSHFLIKQASGEEDEVDDELDEEDDSEDIAIKQQEEFV